MYIQPLISFLLILFFSSSLSHAQVEPKDSLHNQDLAKIFGTINQQDWNNQIIPANEVQYHFQIIEEHLNQFTEKLIQQFITDAKQLQNPSFRQNEQKLENFIALGEIIVSCTGPDDRMINPIFQCMQEFSAGMLRESLARYGEQIINPLLDFCDNPKTNSHGRAEALLLIKKLLADKQIDQTKDKVKQYLLQSLQDSQFLIRSFAVRAVEDFPDPDFLPILHAIAETDPFETHRAIDPGNPVSYPLRDEAKKVMEAYYQP